MATQLCTMSRLMPSMSSEATAFMWRLWSPQESFTVCSTPTSHGPSSSPHRAIRYEILRLLTSSVFTLSQCVDSDFATIILIIATQPLSRFFHAAALIKDTMVIVGGRTEEEDYSNSVSLYQINCNTWIHPGGCLNNVCPFRCQSLPRPDPNHSTLFFQPQLWEIQSIVQCHSQ